MTTLTDKPVRRKVNAADKRGIVVTLYPNGLLGLRVAKTRTEHTVPLARCFRLACEITAETQRKEREQARDAARAAKGLPPRRKLVKRGLL